jgi:cephalosporin hydroxylase
MLTTLETVEKIYEFAEGLHTDKGTVHSYLDVYAIVFGPRRHEVENVMEIGVFQGGSMVLWERFFPKAKILGVDVSLHDLIDTVDESRTSFLVANAYSAETLSRLQEWGVLQDVIIDDGPHTLESMLYVVSNFTQLLKPGGTLVIEDVQHPDWIPHIVDAFPEDDRKDVVVVDRRKVKGRYDDILIIYNKPKPCTLV